MTQARHVTILGGGPAGLAAGYYARKYRLPFTIYEESQRIGGNCVTIQHGEFLFDSGAHRLHDKYEDVTQEIKNLLGSDLRKVEAPSQIFLQGKWIDFPLSPLNLVGKLGFWNCTKSGFELFQSRMLQGPGDGSFEDFAVHTYGRNLADRFLLRYSEKLWGLPCKSLSPGISGSRMKGLGLKTFFIEAVRGRKAKTEHLDGSFYYPVKGYGEISNALAEFCGSTNIRKNSKVTRIFHDGKHFEAMEVNGHEKIEIDHLLNTLPVNLFLFLMEPAIPEEVSVLARSLRFRSLILTAFFIKRSRLTPNASIYFPDPEFPFTRAYEPKNRSEYMSPADQTSLVVEIPCSFQDELWTMRDEELVRRIRPKMSEVFQLEDSEIIDAVVFRIKYAYPILQLGFEQKVAQLLSYLDTFENLQISGRGGRFAYTHLHDMMKSGQLLIQELVGTTAPWS